MSVNPNVNEAGWFYHAPARRKDAEPVQYPAMSQIPGLAEDYEAPDEPRKPLFRDTDTKYVRLAKQGGRPNLLQMKENSSEKREPVLYPRNEWFYLEDNALEDEAEKRKNQMEYAFLRPEYMIHEAYKADKSAVYQRPGRGPIAFDKLSVFEREQGSATDKTVKLPEVRKPGYGIRSGKPVKLPKHKKPQSAPSEAERGPHPLKYLPMSDKKKKMKKPVADTQEKPKMSKLLGYAYEREWQDELKSWQDKQEVGLHRHRQMTQIPPDMDEFKMQSEYAVSFGKRTAAIHSDYHRAPESQQSSRHSEGKHVHPVRQTETQRLREARLQKPPPKDPFKMARFKNVPARIETHRVAQHQPVPVLH